MTIDDFKVLVATEEHVGFAKEICDELNISIKTYIRKLYKFGLRDKDGQGEIV